MKKLLWQLALFSGLFGFAFITSCNEPDVYEPVITLNGSDFLFLNRGDTFLDPGAAGNDFNGRKETRDLSEKIVRSGEVNTLATGQYSLAYNLRDEAGNQASQVSRTVVVRHRAEDLQGQYLSTDSCAGSSSPYLVSIDSSFNGNKLRAFNFGNSGSALILSLKGNFNTEVFLESQVIGNNTYAGSGNISKDGKDFFIRFSTNNGNLTNSCSCRFTKF